MLNRNLSMAKINKNDEFYTQMKDIESELSHYVDHFEGKTIYMNADNPEYSQFWRYFKDNFEELKLKHIVATYMSEGSDVAYRTDYDGVNEGVVELSQNGDFRSDESIEILKQVDIVVTNPPFTLYQEYVAQLIEYGVDYIIVGNYNSVTYKDIFPLIKGGRMWVGMSPRSMEFITPNGELKSVNSCWFTNLKTPRVEVNVPLTRSYSEGAYPNYDNFDAIEVGRVSNIPHDYYGVMGVPITYLTKHNSNQFEILGSSIRGNSSGLRNKTYSENESPKYNDMNACSVIKDDDTYILKYMRVFIRRKV